MCVHLHLNKGESIQMLTWVKYSNFFFENQITQNITIQNIIFFFYSSLSKQTQTYKKEMWVLKSISVRANQSRSSLEAIFSDFWTPKQHRAWYWKIFYLFLRFLSNQIEPYKEQLLTWVNIWERELIQMLAWPNYFLCSTTKAT